MNQGSFDPWHAKLHAWLHDPPEKPLVLMRDPGRAHEWGTAAQLREAVFGVAAQASARIGRCVQRADWWASAADRASFPQGRDDGRYPEWQQAHFTEAPILVHPVSGAAYELDDMALLDGLSVELIKKAASTHMLALVRRDAGGKADLRRTQLAFWRFAPELDAGRLAQRVGQEAAIGVAEQQGFELLGRIWPLLPADTRTPDHTIWQHLDLTSAFAGAFAADPDEQAALLSLTFGPIQPFIEAGRSTSDLWAGSHFLSRLAWEGIRVIAEELGPDAVLFPQLRGVPLVDAWLAETHGLRDLFEQAGSEWLTCRTDANPLFVAALPNKLVAVVPASRAQALAEKAQQAMRDFVMETGELALQRVLEAALKADAHAPFDPQDKSLPAWAQLREQLGAFPEVHWTAVPFALAASKADADRADPAALKPLLEQLHPPHPQTDAPGFLASRAWQALQGLSRKEGREVWFWAPRPAALYPALYDLLDRTLAACKSLRPFEQWQQEGYRCSLSAQTEWLTCDRAQLAWSPGQREKNGTLWTRVARIRPSWVKKGEHLGALALIKRLWPTLFAEWSAVQLQLQDQDRLERYVVSSHALALSTSLGQWLQAPHGMESKAARNIIESRVERSALPRQMLGQRHDRQALDIAARIPAYLDQARERQDAERRQCEKDVQQLLGRKPETYYGLLLMDGDSMGQWLAADHQGVPEYEALFHPQIRNHVVKNHGHLPELEAYLKAKRAASPAFHAAISAALNAFALELAPRVVERMHKGRLLYAGGDDVMALSATDDLPRMMQVLRAAYSGQTLTLQDAEIRRAGVQHVGGGHAMVDGRLLRMLGEAATASTGAVIAHQMAPLAAVLRELREAERRAKREGGRDAFSLSLIKRSGGVLHLTAKWHHDELDTLSVLARLRDFLRQDGVSRRAVYNTLEWLRDLPEPQGDGDMLQTLLAFQLKRQAKTGEKSSIDALAGQLVRLTLAESERQKKDGNDGERPWSALAFLGRVLSVAEFMAREQRAQSGRDSAANHREAAA